MKYSTLLALLASIGLTACQQDIDTPKQVTEQYWQAFKNGDIAGARTLATQNSQSNIDSYLALPDDEKNSLNGIILGEELAIVSTIISIQTKTTDPSQSATKKESVKFDTVLMLENGQWKVDASRTQNPARQEAVDTSIDDQLSDALQQNLESLDEAMEQGADVLNKFMQEGSKEMSESLLKGMNKMNETMREAIEKMKQRREQQDSPTNPDSEKENGEGLI